MEPFVLFVVVAGAVALGYVSGQALMFVWYAIETGVQHRRWQRTEAQRFARVSREYRGAGDRWVA